MSCSRLRSALTLILAAGSLSIPACSWPQFLQRDVTKPPVVPPVPSQPVVRETKALVPGERTPKADVVVVAPQPNVPEDPNAIVPPAPIPASMTEPDQLQYSLLQPRERGPRPDGPLVSAIRAHLDNQYGVAVGHLSAFDKPNQELLLLLLPLLDSAKSTDLTGRDPRSVGVLARQIDSISDLVNKSAPLEIKTTAFVYKVVQFGIYDPLPLGHLFLPGGTAVLYAEIDRAADTPALQSNGEAGFVTKLDGSLQLKDAAGQVVSLYDKESGKMVPDLPFKRADFTRSPVRDFFLKVEFPVPEKPGRYSLILEIRDPNPENPRRSRKVVEFQVGG